MGNVPYIVMNHLHPRKEGGARIVLESPKEDLTSLSCKLNETSALKEIFLAPSNSLVCRSSVSDEIDVEFTNVNRFTNRLTDSLVTLASKRKKFKDDEAIIKISKRRTLAL
ncbi:unnamed protein product [Ilex paraguariensis]|uniref:Uncharacterized protein n=1 Tax=Ilex paraguariensis TaxID=185542 RepID=A0ABC8S4H0_9AQUA